MEGNGNIYFYPPVSQNKSNSINYFLF